MGKVILTTTTTATTTRVSVYEFTPKSKKMQLPRPLSNTRSDFTFCQNLFPQQPRVKSGPPSPIFERPLNGVLIIFNVCLLRTGKKKRRGSEQGRKLPWVTLSRRSRERKRIGQFGGCGGRRVHDWPRSPPIHHLDKWWPGLISMLWTALKRRQSKRVSPSLMPVSHYTET